MTAAQSNSGSPTQHFFTWLCEQTKKESLKKQMETWTREGVIEESVSPWASPMVPAKKQGGAPGEIRWAVDFRQLNEATVGDSYPIPNIEEVLERLAGSKYYSSLDAAAAYHTVPEVETPVSIHNANGTLSICEDAIWANE